MPTKRCLAQIYLLFQPFEPWRLSGVGDPSFFAIVSGAKAETTAASGTVSSINKLNCLPPFPLFQVKNILGFNFRGVKICPWSFEALEAFRNFRPAAAILYEWTEQHRKNELEYSSLSYITL
jgi:hypothetical protein